MWVATRADFITHGGLPRAALRADALPLESVDPANNILELPGHFFTGSERVRFVVINGARPGGLSAAWQTVATPDDPDFFSLVGVTLTDAGEGTISLIEDFGPKLDKILLAWTSFVVANAKAYAGPWETPPDWAPMTVCQLAAPTVANALRIPTNRYSVEDIKKAYADQMAFVRDDLAHGVPMADGKGPIDATPGFAEMAPVAVHMVGDFDLEDGRA